jgi:hypothetical protein
MELDNAKKGETEDNYTNDDDDNSNDLPSTVSTYTL